MLDTADVSETDSEEQLVSKAQTAVSRCNWVVGACAAQWTRKYARGRTDADFGSLVGLSGDQIFQRRRVWETFADVHQDYPRLKWSHFYVAINWDDAPECLQCADENEATVAEMRAWRRALRGEDLSTEAPAPDPWGGDPAIQFVPEQPVPVRNPGEGERAPVGAGARVDAGEREPRETQYAPFRADAGKPLPKDGAPESTVLERPRHSAEDLMKRLISTLERANRMLTPSVMEECSDLPRHLHDRFAQAVAELSAKAAELG